MRFIPTGKPSICEEDVDEVISVLKSGWLTTGPKVEEFERKFSDYIGCDYSVAVSSGTAALELALTSLGIQDGATSEDNKVSEIITTAFTFVATANSILYNNLKPVFVDIKPDTLNINPEEIRKAITKKTKAIICVDYAGQPCDIDEIKKIAQEHNLFLIEDAAQAHGAEYKGKRIGAFADLTIFSFHPLKNMTTGEGGMITTNNKELYDKLILLRNHGLDKTDQKFGGPWSYNLKCLGRNYRLTDFQCALGISQLKKLDKVNHRRKEIIDKYRVALSLIPEIDFQRVSEKVVHSWHLFVILLKGINRNLLFNELKQRGVNANLHYIPIYKFDYYQGLGYNLSLPVTEDVFSRILTLPLYPEMSDEEVDYVIQAVKESITILRRKTIKIVAIIPARGGSKGIPGKNIKLLAGKPLISYPIELAKSVSCIDKVVVSTDSEEIAQVARKYGAEVPFIRPAELAQDETPTLPVLQHCVKYLEEHEDYTPDLIILLCATSPFLKKERVEEAINLLKSGGYNTVISVQEDRGKYWEFNQEKNKYGVLYPKQRVNRQYYKPLYKENAAIYFFNYETIMIKNKGLDENSIGFVIMGEDEVIDLDTPLDWKKAEEMVEEKAKEKIKENVEEEFEEKVNFNIIKIENRLVGKDQPCFIIAEAGVNHNGSLDLAKKLVDVAVDAGADAVKFQILTAKGLYVENAGDYITDLGNKVDLHKVWEDTEVPDYWVPELVNYCRQKGIIFFSSVFEENTVEMLDQFVNFYKIASSETTHIPLIKKIAKTGKPIIIPIGGAVMKEVEEAVSTFKEEGNNQVAVLQCVPKYPTPLDMANVNAIKSLKEKFPDIVVGYSDHSLDPLIVPVAAITVGAKIIEKHFTLSRDMEGIDHKMSLEPEELKQMVQGIREAEEKLRRGEIVEVNQQVMGNGEISLAKNLESTMKLVRRKIFATRDIQKGELFTKENLAVLRPGKRGLEENNQKGLHPREYFRLLNSRATIDISKYSLITKELFDIF